MKTQTDRFLNSLFGRYFQDHDGYLEIRFVSRGTALAPRFYYKGQISDSEWEEIQSLNRTHHIFFGVNPRREQSGKQQDIKDLICLWADIDAKDFDGGKEAALTKVHEFTIQPSIVVDSGHGFHTYWILTEPIINLSEDQRYGFRQVLAGLVGKLSGDRSRVDLASCLRLPGTFNIKDDESLACRVIEENPDRYDVFKFDGLQDVEYKEPSRFEGPLPPFGTKELIISAESIEKAQADVERLELKSSVKRHILTGALRTEKNVDHTRSGRDWLIIASLVFADYNYTTIRSIFLNPKLKCSDRIMAAGEEGLKWDVSQALEVVKSRRAPTTPQSEAVLQIRSMKISPEEKRQAINHYIVEDLLTGPNPKGRGFRELDSGALYYFDNEERMPWDIGKKDEGTDFYYFMRDRYEVARRDFDEIRDAVATEIKRNGPAVQVHRVAYWDEERGVLYLSNHANQIIRMDGVNITLIDNGEEGVFFHFEPRLTSFTFDEQKIREASNYFLEITGGHTGTGWKLDSWASLGLRLDKFYQSSLINEFLVSKANFAPPDSDNPVNEEQQRLLLLLYFYSLFFESILPDKPIACFLGLAASGKSTTASAIGRILFGDSFTGKDMPNSARDFKVVIGRNYFYEIDNVDERVSGEICDVLAAAATGAEAEDRTLHTSSQTTVITPHCFFAITSREPKFKRPDIVDRLLVFRMKKISKDRHETLARLRKSLSDRRDDIMAEVISNLNSIVFILREWKSIEEAHGDDYYPMGNTFRMASWESIVKRICSLWPRIVLQQALEAMMSEKAVMTIDEDYVFQTINNLVMDQGEELRELTSAQLYQRLRQTASLMDFEDFGRAYPTMMSMAHHIPHIAEAMAERLYVKIEKIPRPGHPTRYTFLRPEQEPVVLPEMIASWLGLEAGVEYDPQNVLNWILEREPQATITVYDLIAAFGVRKKDRAGEITRSAYEGEGGRGG